MHSIVVMTFYRFLISAYMGGSSLLEPNHTGFESTSEIVFYCEPSFVNSNAMGCF